MVLKKSENISKIEKRKLHALNSITLQKLADEVARHNSRTADCNTGFDVSLTCSCSHTTEDNFNDIIILDKYLL